MLRRLSPFLGIFFGVLLTVPLLLAGSTFFLNQKAAAADATCFVPIECVSDIGNTDTCTTKGCCNAERCFEPDSREVSRGGCGKTNGKANGRCYAKSQPIDLIIDIGGKKRVLDLGDYFAAIYTYAVGIAGVLATVLMMIGGFEYLTGRPAEGMKRIRQAIAGMGLTFAAYLVLNTVNPDLVILRLPKIQVVKKNDFALCKFTDKAVACGKPYGIIRGADGQAPTAEQLQTNPKSFIGDDPAAANVVAKCTGLGCKAITEDATLADKCVGGGCLGDKGCTDDLQFKCTPNRNDNGPEVIKACSGNAFGSCVQCAPVLTECGEGKAPCCGSCVAGKCQIGAMGERCSTVFGGCKENFKCVRAGGVYSKLFEVVTETGISNALDGYCYAGGVGGACNDGNDCKDSTLWCAHINSVMGNGNSYCVPKNNEQPIQVGQTGSGCGNGVRGPDGKFMREDVECAAGLSCVSLASLSTEANFEEYGICSDGAFGAVCGFSATGRGGTPTTCQPGLICVSATQLNKATGQVRTWTDFWGDVLSAAGGYQTSQHLGACLDGKDGSPCVDGSHCASSYTCKDHICTPV